LPQTLEPSYRLVTDNASAVTPQRGKDINQFFVYWTTGSA